MRHLKKKTALALTLAGVIGALAAGAAWAQSFEFYTYSNPQQRTYARVAMPGNINSVVEAQQYTDTLLNVIDRACRQTSDLGYTGSYRRLRNCVEMERQRVAAEEPTGLFADSLGETRATAQSRYYDLRDLSGNG